MWEVSPYNEKMDLKDVVVYDSTLREGDQAPGVGFTIDDKIKIAGLLDEVGIPQLDAGFPAVSEAEKESVKAVSDQGFKADILCLARAKVEDVDMAIDTGADGVIVFVPTSPILLKEKMEVPFNEARDTALTIGDYAKDHGLFVALTAEDGTRTGYIALWSLFDEAELVGLDRVHIADTTGCIQPEGMELLISRLAPELKIPLGVHCHDDFGLALANSLAALRSGAKAVSTTVNGIGERAGNCPTEELIMTLKALYGTDLGLNTEKLTELSKMVECLSGMKKGDAKPIVGKNVFTHESGVHVAAVLKNPLTYEPFLPEVVGGERRIVLGKHSGKKAVEHVLGTMGVSLDEAGVQRVLEEIKKRAGEGKRVDDEELKRIVRDIIS